jgi:hypothetical protein
MGGDLTIESEPGGGPKFTIRLPTIVPDYDIGPEGLSEPLP